VLDRKVDEQKTTDVLCMKTNKFHPKVTRVGFEPTPCYRQEWGLKDLRKPESCALDRSATSPIMIYLASPTTNHINFDNIRASPSHRDASPQEEADNSNLGKPPLCTVQLECCCDAATRVKCEPRKELSQLDRKGIPKMYLSLV
jgi:hypothetical protein